MMKLFDGKYLLTTVLKIAQIILLFLALFVIYSFFINDKSEVKKDNPNMQIEISQEKTKEELNNNKINVTVAEQQIVQEPIVERCECPNNNNDNGNGQIQKQVTDAAAAEQCNKNNTNQEFDLGLLNRLAIEFGTDKGPIGHNYTRIYAKYFAPLKEKPIRFLELGLFKGNSVKMWEKYFTNAELHFLDYSPQYLQYYSNRSTYHYMDQTDKAKVKEFAEKFGLFDVIIDDASHRSPETIAAFEALISHVKPGGMYFIEDLHLLYYTQWGGAGNPKNPKLSENSIHHFLRDRIEDVHAPGAASEWASNFNMTAGIIATLNDYSRRMESIQFYNGLCIITIREDILKP